MRLPRFEYVAPETLEEALTLLHEGQGEAMLLAGGTDLMLKMRRGLASPRLIVGLKRVEGLNRIVFDLKKGLRIGATALLCDVAEHPVIRKRYPAVAHAAQETANVQVRNMGTLVGNLCNAAPSADNAPTLLAMGADVILTSVRGERTLPLSALFKGPGVTALEPDEIMTAVSVSLPPPGSGTAFMHLSARGKVDISAVCVGVMLVMKGATCLDAGIGLGAVAPIPLKARRTETLIRKKRWTPGLMEEAAAEASRESAPISDMRASAEYRRHMVAVLTKRALAEARERAMHS
jgi:carbon-monoxide dehydrogenase medium subunit